jgi:two-component system phosphate regulon sensor histidine kinase PhoR
MWRKRLIWQLYPSFLIVVLIALIAAVADFSQTFRRFYYGQMRSHLHTLAAVASPEIAQDLAADPNRLEDACQELSGATNGEVRFTVIAPAGKVIGDSHENPAVMRDHSDRQEIVDALHSGFGQSVRFSPTLGQNMMYVAVPIQRDGQVVAVVRTAVALTAIDQTVHHIYISIAWAVLIITVIAALVSLLLSRSISRPITRMRRVAQLFARGQFDVRVPTAGAAELDDLAKALNEMASQLSDRIATVTSQRNELGTILSSMVEGVFAVNLQGHLVSINKAAAQLLDLDPAQAQGLSVEQVVRNADLQQFVRDTLRSSGPAEADVSFPIEGGRFFHVRGAGLSDPRGERSGAVIVLSDTTRIHQLEEMRRDFVANVSHELKTPVTSIQGFVEALQEGGLEDAEQTRRYVDIIAKHAQRLNAIIDDLLSLSRLEDGTPRRAISFEPVKLKPLLTTAVDLSSVKADPRQITIDLLCEDDLEASLNAPLLEQAVLNLLDNAIKYSDPGSRVEIRADQTGDETAICVADTGCGIAHEHLGRIFERFYVVDKSRSRKLGGTGLGLSIVKHIAQVHGGYVTVESTPGRGSTFTIHLPRT